VQTTRILFEPATDDADTRADMVAADWFDVRDLLFASVERAVA